MVPLQTGGGGGGGGGCSHGKFYVIGSVWKERAGGALRVGNGQLAGGFIETTKSLAKTQNWDVRFNGNHWRGRGKTRNILREL